MEGLCYVFTCRLVEYSRKPDHYEILWWFGDVNVSDHNKAFAIDHD